MFGEMREKALVGSNSEINDLEMGTLIQDSMGMMNMIHMEFGAYWVPGGDETRKVIGTSSTEPYGRLRNLDIYINVSQSVTFKVILEGVPLNV